jgi:hypothetical protein
MNLLKQAENDLLLSQIRDNTQPPPLFVDGKPQYIIKEIEKARLKKMSRGNRKKVLISVTGW